MNTPWVNVAVVVLWLATMSWLVTQKILPSLLVGEPPSYQTILQARREDPRVGWSMLWNERKIGWAVNSTERLPEGLTEIRSRVHFTELPLREMTPGWLQRLVFTEQELARGFPMELESSLVFDALGGLSSFEARVSLPPLKDVMHIDGRVDGSTMRIAMHAGQWEQRQEIPVSRKTLLGDGISPQTHLPDLRAGQTWTVAIFNPLLPSDKPSEILQATVEGMEPTVWGGTTSDTWLVVYRSDPGSAPSASRSPRGKLWVRRDGTVVKQQVRLLNATLTFVRLSAEQTAALIAEVADPH